VTEEEARGSDVPLDLIKERESFVRTFLKKGVEYTEILLQENRELREELTRLRNENARLRAHVASEEAIRDLLKTVERLESERNKLIARSSQLEEIEEEHRNRQREIEQEISDLANLYVASFQLHATLSARRVVRHVCDMLGQLVGAHGFAVYLIEGKKVVPIASEGVDEAEVVEVQLGEGPVGEACLTGIARKRGSDLQRKDRSDPIAVLPLMADGRPIGAVEIITLLEQKTDWVSVDEELFQLLGSQAGTALIAANLYAEQAGPLPALEGIRDRLKPRDDESDNG